MTDTALFCGIALAERIERAEAGLIVAATEAARERGGWGVVMPVAGGFACCADDGSPMNKVAGLGFAGMPDAAELDAIEHTFAAHGVPVSVELCHLADPAVATGLTERGYRLVGFENVLGRALPGDPVPAPSAGVEIRRATADDIPHWLDVIIEGFAHPDGEGVPSHESFPRDVIERAERDIEKAGAVAYLALRDGAVAGGASMRCDRGVAQLTGAATAPAHRRRGVQAALLHRRLRDAAELGCDLAVVTTAPASTSQKNVQRTGFQLLYTRAVLVGGEVG
ncbi:GNAT family N-acetyltransferase [Mycolicibacterium rufum]|uniref:GNAT family N-acetyltransferase n=2 Tax=Mycolicibacterium rufum TaxID=318424 RepID=A0ABY3UFD4_9MYCO|nr:GNAT family N-acetyltransferase [Mycolicibacterium rufum]KGI69553.1 GNAT family acetyltransferase [Mycolicibacterium rufum]ULP35773.1 GNAT family N-acetyltransferase [Mycolicibacterium rufum]